MSGILAVETSTDACSVALYRDGELDQRHEIVPRQHNQRLFHLLRQVLADDDLQDAGVSALAYGSGPGSFTGLRVAASAVQGLAYAARLPVVALPTLAVVARTALAEQRIAADDLVLATIDARVDEVYGAVYAFDNGLPVLRDGPWVAPVADLPSLTAGVTVAAGSGCRYFERFPASWRDALADRVYREVLPRATAMIAMAQAALERGDVRTALQVQPVYVQEEVSWKKVHEQGPLL